MSFILIRIASLMTGIMLPKVRTGATGEPLIFNRSERGSIIVTTNLPFSEWTTLFENTAMVAAMVDRLTFQSYILDMNGQSYRLEQAKKQKR